MLSKAAKREIIDDLASRFASGPSVFVVEYQGLKVKDVNVLRRKLRKTGAEFRVVKNTLLEKASAGTEMEKIKDLFSGPTAIAVCEGESSEAAKIFADYGETFPEMKIKGGIFGGEVVDVSAIERIAKLPSKQELVSELVGLLSSPMAGLAATLETMRSGIVGVLGALERKKETEKETEKEKEEETEKSEIAAAAEEEKTDA